MYFDSHHRAEPLVHAPTVATAHAAAHGTTAHAAHGAAKVTRRVSQELW